MGRQVGVFAGRQDSAVAENLLDLKQVNAGFDQVSGIAVPQTMRGNLFFIPHAWTTLLIVACTPPLSSGVVAQ